jgi:tetratricopeptide (TPR) repeat protein
MGKKASKKSSKKKPANQVAEPQNSKRHHESLTGFWRRSRLRRAVVTIICILSGLLVIQQSWDWLEKEIYQSKQDAAKSDIQLVVARLDSIEKSIHNRLGAQIVSQATRSALEEVLATDSAQEARTLKSLKEGKLDEAIETLTRSGESETRLAAQYSERAARDFYLAGLIAIRVSYPRGITLFNRALEANPKDGKAAAMLAYALFIAGRGDEARVALAKIRNPESLPADQIVMYENILGLFQIAEADYARAQRTLRHALAIAEGLNDRPAQAAILGNLGNLYSDEHDIGKAKFYYTESNAVNNGIDPELMGNQYCNLASRFMDQKNFEEARKNYLFAIDAFSRSDSKDCLVNTYIGLGMISEIHDRDDGTAERYFQLAKDFADKSGQVVNQVLARQDHANTLFILGRLSEGFAELLQAMKIASNPQYSNEVFSLYREMVKAAIQEAAREGNPQALAAFQKSATDSTDRDNLLLEGQRGGQVNVSAFKESNHDEIVARAIGESVSASLIACIRKDRPTFQKYGKGLIDALIGENAMNAFDVAVLATKEYDAEYKYCDPSFQ